MGRAWEGNLFYWEIGLFLMLSNSLDFFNFLKDRHRIRTQEDIIEGNIWK